MVHDVSCGVSEEFPVGIDGRVGLLVKSCTKLLMQCCRDVMFALSHEYISQQRISYIGRWKKFNDENWLDHNSRLFS